MRPQRPPARLRHVKYAALEAAEKLVDGDWGRVTADENGVLTIHGKTQFDDFARYELKPVRPRQRTVRPKKKTPDGPSPVMLAGIKKPIVERQPAPPRPSVSKDVLQPFAPPAGPVREQPRSALRPNVIDTPPPVWITIPGVNREGDWERIGLGRTSHQLSKQLRRGLPVQVPISVNTEILGLSGVDVGAAEAVVRHPEQVKISEETAEKKYPVLTFHRGDVTVVLGFRNPHEPYMMAAYFTGEALKEYQRNRGALGGGGGARRTEGVPKHPRILRKQLQGLGATVTPDPSGKTATVTYNGDVLGQVKLDRPSPYEVGNDWQRMQRKIHSIKTREESRRGVV